MRIAGFVRIATALRHRDFAIYISGNSISLVGTWMQRIAVGWLIWDLTGSGAWLGLVAFADLFPAMVFAPLGGAVADRRDRRRMVLVTQTAAMAQALALFGFTASGLITPVWLLILTLVHGVIIGFNQPARMALVPSLMPAEILPTALAVNAIIFNVARFLGPALAGLIIVSAGVAPAFLCNALSFLAFIISLLLIRPSGGPAVAARRRSLRLDVAEGMRYAARHPGIGPLLVLQATMALCVRPVAELLPGFAEGVFDRGAHGLAMLSSTIGLGAIAGGLWLAGREARDGLTRIAVGGAAFVALSILGFSAAPTFWIALAFAALTGASLVITGVGMQTLIQLSVDGAVRGRVLSLYGMIIRGGPAFGALLIGGLADLIGFRWPLAVGAVATLAVWAIFWRRREALRRALEG